MNTGKIFENDFKDSIPEYVLYHRLPDPPQSFGKTARFSIKNPCDAHLFNTKTRTFYTLELKSTKANSFSFENIFDKNDDSKRMIHKHQIKALAEYSKYNYVTSGFIFNFRNEKANTQETYFQNIKDFLKMIKEIDKKSFNKTDLKNYNPVSINGSIKKTHYKWDIDLFLIETKM